MASDRNFVNGEFMLFLGCSAAVDPLQTIKIAFQSQNGADNLRVLRKAKLG